MGREDGTRRDGIGGRWASAVFLAAFLTWGGPAECDGDWMQHFFSSSSPLLRRAAKKGTVGSCVCGSDPIPATEYRWHFCLKPRAAVAQAAKDGRGWQSGRRQGRAMPVHVFRVVKSQCHAISCRPSCLRLCRLPWLRTLLWPWGDFLYKMGEPPTLWLESLSNTHPYVFVVLLSGKYSSILS